uniref:Interferon regulatory factor 7 n=1 Tax=Terrapene triunguis TaxID=2587831 RepID=A0A674IM60_9SAUR
DGETEAWHNLCLCHYRGSQKLRFGWWLIKQINSENYEGLRWVDKDHTQFRIPWKHTSRKDINPNDYKIFKAWAITSGKYNEKLKDLAKWKTNFRCALRSTNMFLMVQDNSKTSEDPHKVYQINSPSPDAVAAANAPTTKSKDAGNTGDYTINNSAPNGYQCSPDTLHWILQQCNLTQNGCSPQQLPWALDGGLDHGSGRLRPQRVELYPEAPTFHNIAGARWTSHTAPVLEALLEALGGECRDSPVSTCSGQALLYSPSIPSSLAETIPPNMDVTIYYRGKPLHEVQVATSSFLFTYNTEDPTVVPGCAQVVQFPSPDELPDQKQVQFTRQLLLNTGLLLEQKHKKIYAKRLNKCKVFWALSRQLVNMAQNPEPKLLPRGTETEIFDYEVFSKELKDFKEHQRATSPDFTIYLCFGQCFSKSKPKETMLILVKLVPKFCEYFHDMVLREGASSLNSGNVSLQLSSCFNSLYDLIEQFNMQID